MNIFGVGLPEMIVILAVALLVFGPRKLPEIGRTIAKTLKSLQDASKEFETQLNQEASAISKATRSTPTPPPVLEATESEETEPILEGEEATPAEPPAHPEEAATSPEQLPVS